MKITNNKRQKNYKFQKSKDKQIPKLNYQKINGLFKIK